MFLLNILACKEQHGVGSRELYLTEWSAYFGTKYGRKKEWPIMDRTKNWIYLIPSFYALCGWTFSILIFNSNVILTDPVSLKSFSIITYTIFWFILSIFINYRYSKYLLNQNRLTILNNFDIFIFVF